MGELSKIENCSMACGATSPLRHPNKKIILLKRYAGDEIESCFSFVMPFCANGMKIEGYGEQLEVLEICK